MKLVRNFALGLAVCVAASPAFAGGDPLGTDPEPGHHAVHAQVQTGGDPEPMPPGIVHVILTFLGLA